MMADTQRMDGPSQHHPHLAAKSIAAIHDQAMLLEDAGPVIVCDSGVRDISDVEQELRQALINLPEVTFSSVSVQRIADGVCLQGLLEYDEVAPDVSALARRVAGVENVLNQLVTRQSSGVEPENPCD